MAYGQPFWNYGANTYNNYNGGYVAPQPQPNYLYNNNQQMPQNGNQQGLNVTQNQQAQQQPIQQPIVPAKTNIAPVASLVDAMSRTSEPNTNYYYADQENPYIYLISIDVQGRKTYKTFEIKDVTEQVVEQGNQTVSSDVLSNYATKDDLKSLKEEITTYATTFINNQNAVKSKTEKVLKKAEVTDTENKENS